MLNIEKYKDIVLENLDACSIDAQLRRKFINVYCKGFNCEGCRERVLKWLLEETKEPVLDDVEKEYLSAVIRPFRSRIKYISKETTCIHNHYIFIDLGSDDIALPIFSNKTMYKGMEADKEYTLKELGLDE